MSVINKVLGSFLTIMGILFFMTNSIMCKNLICSNLSANEQNNKNIIVKKVISEKYQIQKVDRISKFAFEVYPNPTFSEEARIIVNNPSKKTAKIILTSFASGESLASFSTTFTDGLLKFNKVEKGKYLLTIYLESGDFYSKIIILE
jgi:hypothetical protein